MHEPSVELQETILVSHGRGCNAHEGVVVPHQLTTPTTKHSLVSREPSRITKTHTAASHRPRSVMHARRARTGTLARAAQETLRRARGRVDASQAGLWGNRTCHPVTHWQIAGVATLGDEASAPGVLGQSLGSAAHDMDTIAAQPSSASLRTIPISAGVRGIVVFRRASIEGEMLVSRPSFFALTSTLSVPV